MTKGNSVPDYVAIGFDKIDRDLRFLIECLGEVLERSRIGASRSEHLPWFGRESRQSWIAAEVPPQLGLVYSIAFQLLNMVEENAAAYVRSLREEQEGLTAERGLVGRATSRS